MNLKYYKKITLAEGIKMECDRLAPSAQHTQTQMVNCIDIQGIKEMFESI